MSSTRVWLFRGLVAVAIGLLLSSWFTPWWRSLILETGNSVEMHPWGLTHDLPLDYAIYLTPFEMPGWFAPIMWIYLGLVVGLLGFSLLVREKVVSLLGRFKLSLPKLIIWGAGLSYIIVAVTAVIYAAIKTGDFQGLHLIGKSNVSIGGPYISAVDSGLLFGYWLACCAGPLLVVLALLRNRIIGKSRVNV